VTTTQAAFGQVDVLINNAGAIDPIARIENADPAGWDQVIDVNIKGVFYGIHAVLPVMKAQGGGTILTLSSGAAHNAIEGWSHYCASKAAVNMLNRSLHKEEAAAGIRAIGLSPGTVATQMQRDWPARCLMWMCSPDADPWLGDEISLRDEDIRRKVGLI